MKRLIGLIFVLVFGVAFATMKGIPKDVQGFASWKKVVTTGMPFIVANATPNTSTKIKPISRFMRTPLR